MIPPPAAVTAWVRQPHMGIATHRKDNGEMAYQVMGRTYSPYLIELGDRVMAGVTHENSGKPWYREDEVTKRAVQAQSGLGFIDFLQAVG